MKTIIPILLTLLSGLHSFTTLAQDATPIIYRIVAVSDADSTVQSISNDINLYLPLKIYLPTAFSPNGDGLNDTFGAVGEGIDNYKLTVYNRWGEILFSSQQLAHKWDGLYKGAPVPFGTYTYEVQARGSEFGKIYKTGNVTVLN
ncbi:gliding motility-associated C-terminal domain-containing protein [Fulvivirga sp. M361]|uniref:T9SS type B sorting domain-containing protein n=1 Tax=Fulvivirga sp. M361 TaxID=2594266 RepID=UPI001629CF25|nr:gliding motility-associated C-terminal domain-containing protein [Fulvivirga sp. M361]